MYAGVHSDVHKKVLHIKQTQHFDPSFLISWFGYDCYLTVYIVEPKPWSCGFYFCIKLACLNNIRMWSNCENQHSDAFLEIQIPYFCISEFYVPKALFGTVINAVLQIFLWGKS